MPISIRCPVCHRTASLTATGAVWRHQDRAGALCPMSGRDMPEGTEYRTKA